MSHGELVLVVSDDDILAYKLCHSKYVVKLECNNTNFLSSSPPFDHPPDIYTFISVTSPLFFNLSLLSCLVVLSDFSYY